MLSAFSFWTKRLLCADISTQPLVVGGAVVMVAHSSVLDSQPSQQDPVQLALHQANSQETEAGVVQCDGLHWIKGVCKACRVHQEDSFGVLPQELPHSQISLSTPPSMSARLPLSAVFMACKPGGSYD